MSCLVLVIHEMFTNALKYGALSTATGKVSIMWSINSQNNLKIEWQESGGPLVKVPERKGFGTTIVNRSIHHELAGTSAITYAEQGVYAVFEIPEHFFNVSDIEVNLALPNTEDQLKVTSSLDTEGAILLLEDNIFIGRDTEKMVKKIGFVEVYLCANNTEALICLEHNNIKYAILDYNLGVETSERVALQLLAHNIPFFFASGYGNQLNAIEQLRQIPVLIKPYDIHSINKALCGLTKGISL